MRDYINDPPHHLMISLEENFVCVDLCSHVSVVYEQRYDVANQLGLSTKHICPAITRMLGYGVAFDFLDDY